MSDHEKHSTGTPGPWRVESPGSPLVLADTPVAGRIVAGCFGGPNNEYVAEAAPNACLIAAAPTMKHDIERTAAYYRVVLPYLREIADDQPRFSWMVAHTEREMADLERTLAALAAAEGEARP